VVDVDVPTRAPARDRIPVRQIVLDPSPVAVSVASRRSQLSVVSQRPERPFTIACGPSPVAGHAQTALEVKTRTEDHPRGRQHDEGGELMKAGKKRDSSSDSVSTTDMEKERKKMRGKELLTAGLAAVATIHAAHGVYSSMVASENRHKLVAEGEMTAEEARKRKSKNILQDVAAVGIAALGIKSAFSEWKEMNEQRHSVHELEEKRRKRRKAREKRAREMKERRLGGGAGAAYGQNAYPYPAQPYGPTAYADGNPYAAAGNQIPPPPMGAQYPQQYR